MNKKTEAFLNHILLLCSTYGYDIITSTDEYDRSCVWISNKDQSESIDIHTISSSGMIECSNGDVLPQTLK